MFHTEKTLRMFSALAAFAGLVGCAGASDAAPVGTSSDALSNAIPKQEWIAIDLGAQSGAASVSTKNVAVRTIGAAPVCESATPAQFAALSHQIASSANGTVAGLMSMVGQITSQPPVARTDDHAVWGPITSPTAPAVYRFEVDRVDATLFAFRLLGRPKDGDESTWRGVFEGQVAPVDDAHRKGDAHVDFTAAHTLDPSNGPTAGALALHFEASNDARTIALTFAGVTGPGAPAPNDAVYTYTQPNDGAGTFDFVTHADFDDDGKQDELLHVQSRWDAVSGGQAVVSIVGASLPHPVVATECWNATGGAVFYADDASMHPPVGAADCCPK